MLFFFGSSRSWTAREARRKARLAAKKRRLSMIQAAVTVFSLVVFSISMWSLRKMRLSEQSIRHNAHRGNRTNGLERILNGGMKPAVSALHANVEMPKPPLEPESPVSKMDNSSYGTVLEKGTTAESDDVAVRSDTGASTESRTEVDYVEDTSSKESSYDHGSTSRDKYRTGREDGDANINPAVRGMTQEDSVSVHHETSRAYNDQASSTNYGDGDVGKMEEVDMLDSEEGGEGLVITMPKKKSTRIGMRHGKEDMVHDRENLKNARREFAESGRRLQTREEGFVDGNKRMSAGENYHGNRGEQSYTREAMNKPLEHTSSEYKYMRRGSDKTVVHGEQQFGRVYRRDDTGGIDSSLAIQDSLQRDGRRHRVATSNSDVSEPSRFRN